MANRGFRNTIYKRPIPTCIQELRAEEGGGLIIHTNAYVLYAGKPRGKLLHFWLNFGRGSSRTQILYACIWCLCSAVCKVRRSAARSRENANLCERRTSPWPSFWQITLLIWRSTVLALALLASSALPRCRCTHSLLNNGRLVSPVGHMLTVHVHDVSTCVAFLSVKDIYTYTSSDFHPTLHDPLPRFPLGNYTVYSQGITAHFRWPVGKWIADNVIICLAWYSYTVHVALATVPSNHKTLNRTVVAAVIKALQWCPLPITHACMHTHAHAHTCTCTHMHAHAHTCMHMHTHACTCTSHNNRRYGQLNILCPYMYIRTLICTLPSKFHSIYPT